jgi:putative oxidoreductase
MKNLKSYLHSDDLAKLLLRVSIGGLMIFHGLNKLIFGYSYLGESLLKAGIPSFVSHGVLVGELLAPILIVVGYKTRLAGVILTFTMLMTIYVGFRDQIFTLNKFGGWTIELNVLFLFGALAIIFEGSGKYSLSKGKGLWD